MGYEYAVISESGKEFFDLGKGNWHRLDVSGSDPIELASRMLERWRSVWRKEDVPEDEAAYMFTVALKIVLMPLDRAVCGEDDTAYEFAADRVMQSPDSPYSGWSPWSHVGSRFSSNLDNVLPHIPSIIIAEILRRASYSEDVRQ